MALLRDGDYGWCLTGQDENVSINKLAAILNTFPFTYPYHQVLGNYLENAGYNGDLLNQLRKTYKEFDFYLDFQMEETGYPADRRIYYPKKCKR